MSVLRAQRGALLSLSLCVLVITSCRTASEPVTNQVPATDTVVSTTPPFKTKEPERYSATRTITIFSPNGDSVVSRTLIAKDGPMRREEPLTTEVRAVYLDLPEGRFILYPDERIYAAAVAKDRPDDTTEADESSPDLLLHMEPISSTYQSLGPESVNGRSTTKYRIVVNNSGPENVSLNETVMWIDDALNMPIKSETKSSAGTRSVMELSDVALEPDKQLFEIPAGYEKIVFSALEKQLKARRLNPSQR
jgi:outer membrane lipoprotein-sorting protein